MEHKTIDVDGLKKKLNEGALVVNVLDEEQYARQHIPESRNVPVGKQDFGDRMRDMAPDRTTPVVVYCHDRDCEASPKAAKELTEMGFENVYDLEVGIEGWKDAGEDIEGQTQTVRADVQ